MTQPCQVNYVIVLIEVSIMSESRLFKIMYYLLEKGQTSAPTLAEQFEVSIRTIYRDIDAISSAGIPIYATPGKGGGIAIVDDFILDKSLLSTHEKEKIVMALQGIEAIDKKESSELLTKLGALFETKVTNWIEVDFSNWVIQDTKEDIFNTLKTAIFNRNILSFLYFSSTSKTMKRTIEPLKLVFKSKNWYVYGFCQLKQNYRFFKLTRIRDIEVSSKTFKQHTIKPILEKNIHIEKRISVTLKFDSCKAYRVYDEFIDTNIKEQDGFLYVSTVLPDDENIYNYLLSFGEHVEVIEPQSLRKQIQEKLINILNNYKT